MDTLRSILKPVSILVLFGFVTLTLHAPAARAGLIATDTVVSANQAAAARDQLRATLEREDVRQALLARGVRADQVQGRVDALTDSEVKQLNAKMDEMPAGGDALAIAVFVFLVLLLTDILGFTDI